MSTIRNEVITREGLESQITMSHPVSKMFDVVGIGFARGRSELPSNFVHGRMKVGITPHLKYLDSHQIAHVFWSLTYKKWLEIERVKGHLPILLYHKKRINILYYQLFPS